MLATISLNCLTISYKIEVSIYVFVLLLTMERNQGYTYRLILVGSQLILARQEGVRES